MISLCSKMYYASDISEEKIKFSCKGVQKDGNDVNYQKFHDVLSSLYYLINMKIKYQIKVSDTFQAI